MPQRITVNRITSIGAVSEADNPKSRIMLFKSAPEGHGNREVRVPAVRGQAAAQSVIKKMSKQALQIQKNRDGYRAMSKQIEVMKGNRMARSEGPTVRAQVDALAQELVAKGEASNLTQARPMIWKTRPDLVAKSRQEAPEDASDGAGKTISDRVREVIDEATRRASWQPLLEGWGDGQTRKQIIAKVRVEVWRSPDGQDLRNLDHAFGSKQYTPAAASEIRKSRDGERFTRALNLLDSGIWAKGS